MRKAAEAADGPPKTVTSDQWKPYIKATKEVLPETRHIQGEGITADINNNLSERLQGTFRDRIKTLRGMDSLKTGQRYLDGWTLTYNLFRGHESLRNKTPGERAKANPPFKEWADVAKGEAVPLPQLREDTRPKSTPTSPPRSKLPPRQVASLAAPKPRAAPKHAVRKPSQKQVSPRKQGQHPVARTRCAVQAAQRKAGGRTRKSR